MQIGLLEYFPLLRRRVCSLDGPIRRFCASKTESKGDPTCDKAKKKDTVQIKPPPAPAGRATVTLLGVNNQLGATAALSIKLKGHRVQELRLWDEDRSLRGLAMDLSQIPSKTRVMTYVGDGQLPQALRNTDIVVLLSDSWGLPKESTSDMFYKNCELVRDLVRAIVLSSPRAMIGIAVPPITPMVAFFGEMQKSMGASCPNRLFGLLSLEEMRTRTTVADMLGLPPNLVSVKLTGGGTPETLIPVISSANPGGSYISEEFIPLTNKIRGMTEALKEAHHGPGPNISAGVAVSNFVTGVAEGLYGDKKSKVSAVVRSQCLHGIPYIALPVAVGKSGIEGACRIPRLGEQELSLLIKALPKIKADIALGEAWAHSGEEAAISAQ